MLSKFKIGDYVRGFAEAAADNYIRDHNVQT